MIRALRPTDVLAYLAFRRSNPENEALCGADGQALSPNLRGFLGDAISLDSHRAHWALFEKGNIRGIVAVRARFGADVWDVERLMLAPEADAESTIGLLLDHMLRHAVEEGVQRVFLRLRDGSASFVAARRTGFLRYSSEVILVAENKTSVLGSTAVADPPVLIRPRRPTHHQPIFQLYSAFVPVSVRQVEGLTLQEWRWTDGWRIGAIPWSRDATRRQDFVALCQDGVIGWLQVDYQSRIISPLVGGRLDVAALLIERGMTQLGSSPPYRLLLRDYQSELESLAAQLGFAPKERHLLLARTLSIRVPEAKLVPVQAS